MQLAPCRRLSVNCMTVGKTVAGSESRDLERTHV
jgi:hypothetical protein